MGSMLKIDQLTSTNLSFAINLSWRGASDFFRSTATVFPNLLLPYFSLLEICENVHFFLLRNLLDAL